MTPVFPWSSVEVLVLGVRGQRAWNQSVQSCLQFPQPLNMSKSATMHSIIFSRSASFLVLC